MSEHDWKFTGSGPLTKSISLDDFVDALYKAGWRNVCDAQHTEIEKLWRKLCQQNQAELNRNT